MKSAMSSFLKTKDMKYTCKDCIFYKNEVCKSDSVEMYTANFSEACSRFEYKNEFVNNKIV